MLNHKSFLGFHRNKVKYNTLLNQRWNPRNGEYEPNNKGIMSLEESQRYFRHYWLDKNKIKKSIEGFTFKEDMKVQLILRILGPYKLADNPNRYNIAAKYVESGFFTQKQFEEALSEIYEKHKATKWTNIVKSCMREYNLSKIL